MKLVATAFYLPVPGDNLTIDETIVNPELVEEPDGTESN